MSLNLSSSRKVVLLEIGIADEIDFTPHYEVFETEEQAIAAADNLARAYFAERGYPLDLITRMLKEDSDSLDSVIRRDRFKQRIITDPENNCYWTVITDIVDHIER